MRKKTCIQNISSIFILGVFILGIFSCNDLQPVDPSPFQQEAHPNSETITIEQAQSIYNKYLVKDISSKKGKKNHNESVRWEKGNTAKFADGSEAMVVPVLQTVESLALMAIQDNPSTEKNFDQLHTPVKLVIYRDKDGKEKVERLYIKADENYRKNRNFTDGDADFSGTLWFETWEGDFSRAYVYRNGKIFREIRPHDQNGGRGRISSGCGFDFGLTIAMAYYQTVSVQGYGSWGPTYLYTITFNVDYINYETCDISVTNVGEPSGVNWTGSPEFYPGWSSWWNRLNPTEREWVNNNWYAAGIAFLNYKTAERMSKILYSKANPSALELIFPDLLPDDNGSNQNAFKHILAAALHTWRLGPSTASTIVTNHELDQGPGLDKDMDEFNNFKGIQLANEYLFSDEEQLIVFVSMLVNSGGGKRIIINNIRTQSLQNTSSAATDENY